MHSRGSVEYDACGKASVMRGACQDITERKLAAETLEKSYSSLQAVVDSIDAVVYAADMETHEVLLINKYTRETFGDILGEKCWETLQRGQTGPCSFCSNNRLVGADGTLLDTYVWEIQNTVNSRWYECRDKAIRWVDGRTVRIEIATDITEGKKLQSLISQGKKEWEETFDSINEAITIHDRDFTVIRANKTAEKMLGLPFLKLLGQKCYRLYHGLDSPPKGCASCQILKTGVPATIEKFEPHLNKFIEIKAFPLFDEDHQIIKVVHVTQDITERKRMEERLHVLSMTDELTGLYNRRGFFALAEQQLRIAKRQKKGIFLLCADLDNLKGINDRYGHKTGDIALIETAHILKDSFRESDIIARIGGDEFVVLQIEDTATASELLASRLQKNLEIHNTQKDHEYDLSLSIGIAYCEPESTCSMNELMVLSDKLMYEQKRLKRSSQLKQDREFNT
jgi:diguanylate cyclase (GGDEF)-like protein/PAS domain S-box-containing protein